MNKNKFFEKVGKLTFSILLTGLLVAGIVVAANNTWDTYTDNSIITGSEWQKMVISIKNKVNSSDLVQYYTKTESDKKFLSEVHIPTIPMEYGNFKGKANVDNKVDKPECLEGYTPDIQVNLDWFETIGNVNGDDIIGTWYVDKGDYWYINGGDYDCGRVKANGEIIETCGTDDNNYNDSKVSYTTYCTSVAKSVPLCGTSRGTCTKGTPTNVYNGLWTCKVGGESVSCGVYENPCNGSNPPGYCRGGSFIEE